MSAVASVHQHFVFGTQAGVPNSLAYFDEQTIVFPSGNNCVFHDTKRKFQRFVPATEKSQGLQSLAISPDRLYLAVSERGEKCTVTVYELQHDNMRKRKVLCGEDQVQAFVCMAFSHDSQYLIGQSGEPDWTLYFWIWQKNKLIPTIKTGGLTTRVSKVSFSPLDSTQVFVCGHGVFKFFSYVEGTLKQTNSKRQELHHYLSCDWMSESEVLLGTDRGQLLLFRYQELLWRTDLKTTQDPERLVEQKLENIHVTAISAMTHGFACTAGPGLVYLFQKTKDTDVYRISWEIRIPFDVYIADPILAVQQEITSLCVSPQQMSLTVCTDLGQLFTIDLISEKDQPLFQYLTHSSHCRGVFGLSVCVQKPLVATCSKDRTVRIWNYETRILELWKAFCEAPLSVALHPTGLSILVVFAQRLLLLNLLIDDLRTFKEFPLEGCTESAFSHGGHAFAVACGTEIHCFSSTTLEEVLELAGHKKNVLSIAWSEDDKKLMSLDADGAAYEWSFITGELELEIVHMSYMYTSLAISPDSKIIFVMGTDFTLREIHDAKILTEVPTDEVAYTTIALSRSGRVLFCGTNTGAVMAISCPLFEPENFLYQGQGHSAPITKMVVTFDDHFLLTVSEDGCLFIWKIVWERFGLKKEKELCYLEEIFITKTDLEEKNRLMEEQRAQVKQLKIENRFQLCFRDMDHEREMRNIREKYTVEIERLRASNEVLTAENERLELFHKETMEAIVAQNTRDLRILKADTYRKLTHEYEVSHAMQLSSQKKLEQSESKLQKIENAHGRVLQALTERYEARLQENIVKLTASEGVSQQQQQEYEVMKKMIEEDADREILDIRCKYEHELQKEKAIATEYRDETGIMRKKASHVQKEMSHKNTEIEKLKLELRKRQNVVDALQKDIVGFKNEIKLRNSNIEEKEKCISELRNMITDLDKSKFLMDYKIKELLKKVEPNEKIIEEMKQQIQEMESELERFKTENTKMRLIMSELKVKLRGSDTDKRREMQKLSDMETRMWNFKSDLHHCVEFIQDPRRLKEGICKLHSTYLEPSDVEFIQRMDTDSQEVIRLVLCEREEMARNAINSLRSVQARETERHQASTVKTMKENAMLIAEINRLRCNLIILEDQLRKNQLELSRKRNFVEAGSTAAYPVTALPEAQEGTGQLRVEPLKRPSQGAEGQAKPGQPTAEEKSP